MAKIYQKIVGDKNLIIGVRESFTREIVTGSAWREMRIGMFGSLVTGTDDNLKAGTQQIGTQNILSNRAFFGLKDSSSFFPGSANTSFIGIMTSGSSATDLHGTYNYEPRPVGISTDDKKWYAHGYSGSAPVIGPNTTWYYEFPGNGQVEGSSAYMGFMGLKLLINNPGTSNQQIVAHTIRLGTASPPYSNDQLWYYLNQADGAQWTSIGTIDWNNGSVAYPIPNSLFFYMPFTSARMRISAMAANISSL